LAAGRRRIRGLLVVWKEAEHVVRRLAGLARGPDNRAVILTQDLE
jgi:hypothetical protein